MLAKLEDGKLIVAQGNVLKYYVEEVVQIPEITIDEETGEETTTYTEETRVKEIIIVNPSEEDWIKAGYKPLIEGERLPEREGYYQVPVYTDEGDKITTTYEYREQEDPEPIDPEEEAKRRRAGFETEFFETSLGWVRKHAQMKDGSIDNFLTDDLPLLAIALGSGTVPTIIVYDTPDFTIDFDILDYQRRNVPITQQFIGECLAEKQKEFI